MRTAILLGVTALVVVILAAIALRDDEPVSVPYVAGEAPEQRARPEPPPAVTPEPVPPAAEPAPPPVGPEIVNDKAFLAALDELGFHRLEGSWRNWAMQRGYPVTDGSGAHLYEQPYEQYDDQTLRGLSDNGDLWASQILAGRLAKSKPAEALELYRRAAARGSIYAMHEMATLYNRISDKRREVEFKSGERALEQVYAMRDAPVKPEVAGYAWTVVAEMAGSEPVFGALASSQLEARMDEAQLAEACDMAQGIYDGLMAERDAIGLGDFDHSPPPLVYADPSVAPRCPDAMRDRGLDLSACREMVVEQPAAEAAKVWICDGGDS